MPRTRYKALVDSFAADIRAGRLAPGARLPTHRALAARERLALVTASRVYADLAAMGLVSGETGRGTYVREVALPPGLGVDQPEPSPGLADLNFNAPALPGQAALLREALRRLAASGDLDALLRYQPHGGRPHERAAVAAHLATRGLVVDESAVVLTSGAQHGLAVVAMALFAPGDVVAVDALTYPGFKVVAEAQRLELAPVPAAGAGPDLDALEALCRRRRIRAFYTMPTLHNPLGWVTGAARRRRLVAIARHHGLQIIEDAAYAFLVAHPPPPLAVLAPERTLYVSGFSKNVATGLRVGCVAAPPDQVPRLLRAIRATTWNVPPVMTALVRGWLADGTVARLEVAKRADAAARQAIVSEVLSGRRLLRHPVSYHAWLPLADGLRAEPVAAALLRDGVAVSTARPYAVGRPVPQALRLALGTVDPTTLRAALGTVRAAGDPDA